MRKFFSILLLAVFGFSVVSPLFALQPKSESSLPACCRGNGRHHCMMRTPASKPDGAIHLSAPLDKCPYAPTAFAYSHTAPLAHVQSFTLLATFTVHPAGVAQTESKWRISQSRSRQKRGPPATILS